MAKFMLSHLINFDRLDIWHRNITKVCLEIPGTIGDLSGPISEKVAKNAFWADIVRHPSALFDESRL